MSKIFIINGRAGSTLIDHILYHHDFKPLMPMGTNSTEAHELRLAIINQSVKIQSWLHAKSTPKDKWDYCKCCELGARIKAVLTAFPKAKFIVMDRDDVEMVRSNEAVNWGETVKAFFLNSKYWWTEVASHMSPQPVPPTSMSNFEASCYHFLYPKKKAYKDLQQYPYNYHVVSFKYLMSDFRAEIKKLFVFLDYDDLSKIDWALCEDLRLRKLQHSARSKDDMKALKKRLFDLTSHQIRFIRSLQLI